VSHETAAHRADERLQTILKAVVVGAKAQDPASRPGGEDLSSAFAAAGALFKKPMMVGLAYTFVVEGFMANLPGSNQKLTVLYYLKSYLISGYPELQVGDFEQGVLTTPLFEPAGAVQALAMILLGILALGAWRFSRREYVLSA